MFAFKQLVASVSTPLVLALIVVCVAMLCRILGRRRPAAWLCCFAAALVYLAALRPVSDALLGPLEARHAPLAGQTPAVGAIVVLGSSYAPRDGVPVTGALSQDGLVRIVEGLRLSRQLPGAKLVVSGGAPPGRVPSASGYAQLARELGVEDHALVVLDAPLDTGDEARAVTALLGSAPFLLVTSAHHMPRAMRLMTRAGGRPIPAPTGQLTGGPARSLLGAFVPDSSSLGRTDTALHEYVGLFALALGWD